MVRSRGCANPNAMRCCFGIAKDEVFTRSLNGCRLAMRRRSRCWHGEDGVSEANMPARLTVEEWHTGFMASGCCDDKADELGELRERQGRILWIVLVINAVLFFVEFTVGWLSRSTALLADSLDMFGDAAVYGFSLFVLHRGVRARAQAALAKGVIQLGFGFLVLGQAAWQVMSDNVPVGQAMGVMGLVALAGNAWSFQLLWSHRSDDINMRSTWLCSRNDLIANTAVIGAGVLVWWLDSRWPDVIVGVGIAALFLRTAVGVIGDARAEMQQADDSVMSR